MRKNDPKQRKHALIVWKQSLERKHADLEEQIASETSRPLPDMLWIQSLKRHRLRVKEEMTALEGVLRTIGMTAGRLPA